MSNRPRNESLVAIVILNWNGRDDTLACLKSLERIDYSNFKVLVVDNDSSDDSVYAIRAAFPDVDLIQTGANLGFSGGNNAGIQRALEIAADYVLLLNNDTEVDPGLLRAFVAAAERFPDAGAFSGKIYFFDNPGRIWYAGAKWDLEASRFVHTGEGLDDDQVSFTTPSETAYACGCAFFVPAHRLREIGLLDKDFFLYFEETDWCYRARNRGHPSIFVPDAKLWHKVSVSVGEGSPLAVYFVTRNRLLWATRYVPFWKRRRIYADVVRSLVSRFIFPLDDGRPPPAFAAKEWRWFVRDAFRNPQNRAYFLGVRDFLLGRFGNCPTQVRELTRRWAADRVTTPNDLALSRSV